MRERPKVFRTPHHATARDACKHIASRCFSAAPFAFKSTQVRLTGAEQAGSHTSTCQSTGQNGNQHHSTCRTMLFHILCNGVLGRPPTMSFLFLRRSCILAFCVASAHLYGVSDPPILIQRRGESRCPRDVRPRRCDRSHCSTADPRDPSAPTASSRRPPPDGLASPVPPSWCPPAHMREIRRRVVGAVMPSFSWRVVGAPHSCLAQGHVMLGLS